MSQTPAPQSVTDADELEVAANQAIEACGGDVRNALKALIVANDYLELELSALQAAVSSGYSRGRLVKPKDKEVK